MKIRGGVDEISIPIVEAPTFPSVALTFSRVFRKLEGGNALSQKLELQVGERRSPASHST